LCGEWWELQQLCRYQVCVHVHRWRRQPAGCWLRRKWNTCYEHKSCCSNVSSSSTHQRFVNSACFTSIIYHVSAKELLLIVIHAAAVSVFSHYTVTCSFTIKAVSVYFWVFVMRPYPSRSHYTSAPSVCPVPTVN